MKTLSLMAAFAVAMAGSAFAGEGCCKPAGCCPRECAPQSCHPVYKTVDVKKTCYEIECKTVAIPAITFPWQTNPCKEANACGQCGAQCGAGGQCGSCGTSNACGAGCGDRDCGGLFSRIANMCGTTRTVSTLKKSEKKVGEKCVCEWVLDGCGSCGAMKPGCCTDGMAPPASAPAQPETAPSPPPAPPETAIRLLPGTSARATTAASRQYSLR